MLSILAQRIEYALEHGQLVPIAPSREVPVYATPDVAHYIKECCTDVWRTISDVLQLQGQSDEKAFKAFAAGERTMWALAHRNGITLMFP